MKKLFCLLLCLVMVLSLAACGEKEEQEDTTPVETTEATEPESTGTEPTQPQVAPLDSFYMDYKEADWTEASYLQASPDGNGKVVMEYKTATGRKQGVMELDVMVALAQFYESEESGMKALNGQEIYEEGEACASMYLFRGEESCSYSYYGEQIPEDYKTLFETMTGVFEDLMVDVEEYVAKPQMGEGVNEAHADEILEVLSNSGIAALDTMTVMDVAKDEFFASNAGLSGAEGIESCTSCTTLMMAVPYSLVVVTVEEGVDVNTVVADFVENVDWLKWVCVQPTDGTVAVKDNMVLCLLGQDEMYFGTAGALEEAGWTVVETMKNKL